MVEINKIAILGAGAFGYAIAHILSSKHPNTKLCLYDINKEHIAHIEEKRFHPVFHKDHILPNNVIPTTNITTAVKDADLIIISIPSKFFRDGVQDLKHILKKGAVLLSLVKGLEQNTNLIMSEVIKQELSPLIYNEDYKIAALSGGMIASEVIAGNPLCADVACEDLATAQKLKEFLQNGTIRIEITDDLVGVEYAGSIKNVVAIGAGIFDGLGHSESSKSAFLSESAKEVKKLAIPLGAHEKTFELGGFAWIGDLITTCFGDSRNREFGERIGTGGSAEEILAQMKNENKSVEGYITSKVVHEIIKKHQIKAPLLEDIYQILHNEKTPEEFLKTFIKDW